MANEHVKRDLKFMLEYHHELLVSMLENAQENLRGTLAQHYVMTLRAQAYNIKHLLGMVESRGPATPTPVPHAWVSMPVGSTLHCVRCWLEIPSKEDPRYNEPCEG